uniref:Uncharacterized protein n=1 Tax=Caenorhabditis japonica TaxID=281687 RepID=A0A8R1DJY2_CAEJA
MHHSTLATFSLLLAVVPLANTFLWGGGCCGAPVIATPCCGATSWAYAPPQVIGYERIPLYAKVPMPAPVYYYAPPPPPPAPPAPYPIPYYAPPPPPMAPIMDSGFAAVPIPAMPAPLTAAIPPPPPGKYGEGDVIAQPPPPPPGYVSSQPQGYGAPPPPPQQPIVGGGQVENGIEVTPEQVASGYQPQVASIPPSAAYEATGVAPSARRLRKFKN